MEGILAEGLPLEEGKRRDSHVELVALSNPAWAVEFYGPNLEVVREEAVRVEDHEGASRRVVTDLSILTTSAEGRGFRMCAKEVEVKIG